MQATAGAQQPEGPFRLDAPVCLAHLRQALTVAGYTRDALAQTADTQSTGGRLDVPAILRRTARPSPYNTLVRLFLLGQEVSPEAAGEALRPANPEALAEVGLLESTAAGVRSVAALLPFGDLLVAHDLPADVTGRPFQADHVLGVGAASITLADMTVRRRVGSALDLGTGSGFQALLASPHAGRVVGTDTNARALGFAAFNARLNGIDHLECRRGSLYEPVRGELFDLIVANPPFVISPESRYIYRDSGMPGDAICEQVVRGAPAALSEGGYAVVLFNWHHQQKDSWSTRPLEWIAGSGCDAWFMCFETTDALEYAIAWLRQTETRNPGDYGRLLDEWLEYYERIGIAWLSCGVMVLRRCSRRPNWVRTDVLPVNQRAGSAGGQIERIFLARDLLWELGDERELLNVTLMLTPDHQLEQVLYAEQGGWTAKAARLKQTKGFEFRGSVDRMVGALAAGCDGRRPLRDVVSSLADGLGVEYEQIAAGAVAAARQLMEAGFLSPVERPAT